MGGCLPKSKPFEGITIEVQEVEPSPRQEEDGFDQEPPPDQNRSSRMQTAHLSSSFMDMSVVEEEFPLAESCELEWLNVAIEALWPHVDKALQAKVQQEIEPALKLAMPGPLKSIHFSRFDLGETPPVLGPLQLYKKDKQRHMGIELDIGVNWTCDAAIRLEAPPVFELGIKNFRLEGEFSIVLRPLMDSLPIVGGIQLFMISPPKIDWEFDTEGVAGVVDCPMVSARLREVVHDALCSNLVLPNRVFVHWIWGREHEVDITAMHFPVPEAVIRLGVTEARDLDGHDWHLFAKATSDPYVVVQVGARSHTTPTRKATLEPKWGEEGFADFFCFNQKQFISIEVWDEDFTGADLIGRLGGKTPDGSFKRLRIWELLKEPDCWWPVLVEDKDGKLRKAGEVKMKAKPYVLSGSRDKLAVKIPPRGPAASHTALVMLQLRALRGLPKERATGAKLSITCEDQVLETKASVFHEPYQDETYVEDVPIDPAFQRTLEHLATKTKPPLSSMEIAQISGLPQSQVERILKMRPSFTAQWMQGFNILVRDVDTAILDIKLLIPGKDLDGVGEEVRILEPIPIRSVAQAPHMSRDELLELSWQEKKESAPGRSTRSLQSMMTQSASVGLFAQSNARRQPPAELTGPFDLDAQVFLFALSEAPPEVNAEKAKGKPKKASATRASV